MSVRFAKCPFCKPDARAVRMYGTGVCLYHFQNPPSVKGGPKVVVAATAEEVAAIVEAKPPTKKELDAWFAMQVQQRPRTCEEPGCGHLFTTSVRWVIKASIAHVIPKRHFHSVAIHPLNRIFLCKHHHDDYDNNWAKAETLGCWPLAVERFQLFMHLITDKEIRFLPPALRELTNR